MRGAELLVISLMGEELLRDAMQTLDKNYGESENLQDVAVNGKILALAYIRLHDRKSARAVLHDMTVRLRAAGDDWIMVIEECEEMLERLD